MKSPVLLSKTQPLDLTPDNGPRRRGGLLSYTLAFSTALLSFGLASALYLEQHLLEAGFCLAAFVLIAGFTAWRIFRRLRFHGSLPRSHSVLANHLGFKIDYTCGDIAMTAFFQDDSLEAGKPTSLLCFVENYASRQRVAKFLIGPHPHLGLAEAHPLHLQLAAGQAAIYVLPLHTSVSLAPGEHDLPIALSVEKPSGTGLLLPGARRHLHNLWHVHFAAPFTIIPRASASKSEGLKEPRRQAGYYSLASVSEMAPRLDILDTLP